ncbi:MAG: cellulase family glycosylhydrolase [Verrucomicrobiota bacterium]|nr:cellulase family glycosylhydrolase [Limisphaera sp.]MDW8381680.1 cellulase family glycosylhydrolase [Verrucomicrobiota bacterium]
MRGFYAFLLLYPPAWTTSAQLPPLVLPEGVGVNIHFVTGHEADLDMIARAGFRFIRMDFSWESIESRRGHYDWTAYEELTRNLERRQLRPLYILDYSHPLYEDRVQTTNPITGRPEIQVASPRKPESIQAFARWAAAAAGRYAGRGVVWEIWNEPNIFFWRPRPNVEEYLQLAEATCQAIRETDPQATLIAPSLSGFDPPFMDRFLSSGILRHLDGVSVHPYRFRQPPETAEPDYRRLRQAIDQSTPPGRRKPIPIVSSEWGWSTDGKDVTEEQQAAYLVRQQLFHLWMGIPLSIWYDWKNDGPDPHEREHNFGTVHPDLTPKPAYRAVQTMTRELSGYALWFRHNLERPEDWWLVLTNASGRQKWVAWSIAPPRPVLLPVAQPQEKSPVRLVTGLGEIQNLWLTNGLLALTLESLPVYLDPASFRLEKAK